MKPHLLSFQFTCRIVAQTPDGDRVDHFEEGMAETVVVDGIRFSAAARGPVARELASVW